MKILRFKDDEVVTDALIDRRCAGFDRIQLTVTQREQLHQDRLKRFGDGFGSHLTPSAAGGLRIEVIG